MDNEGRGQGPAIVVIDTADTDLLSIESALRSLPPGFPPVIARNPMDAPLPAQAAALAALAGSAGVVVLRVLGGKSGWPAGFDLVAHRCRDAGVPFIACPGHEEWDDDVVRASTVPPADIRVAFGYMLRGGAANFRNLLGFLADRYLQRSFGYGAPQDLPWEGIYHPSYPDSVPLDTYLAQNVLPNRPTVGVLFYRSHWMSGNLQFVDTLVRALEEKGANVIPVFSYSLVHNPDGPEAARRALTDYMIGPAGRPRIDCLINTMGHTMGRMGGDEDNEVSERALDVLKRLDVPVLQAIVSTAGRAAWEHSPMGLGPLDIGMNVALPEFDGRIITVPISFKERQPPEGARVDADLRSYVPEPSRIDLLCRLAVKWAVLRRKPNSEKRIAIILSTYPSRNARIGNGVGLDTPASVIAVLHALRHAGYTLSEFPPNGDDLIKAIIDRCSNDREWLTEEQLRLAAGHMQSADYLPWFDTLPAPVQQAMRNAWGEPPGTVYRTGDDLAIAGLQFGNIFVGLQPPRGFGENPIAIYHTPDLVPPHHYLAYYLWLRKVFRADAIVHVGKHGTLEWLPGKGVGLSPSCYPEIALDDLPLFYPFIVNDPGEGAQAKRRAHAAIIDHSIPPMTTADSYGDIARLEQLLDEHYRYQTLDPSKAPLVESQIWNLVVEAQLHRDLGQEQKPRDFPGFIQAIDGYLCEIKDAQIKEGLHVLGQPPTAEQLPSLLSLLTRLDNGDVPSLRRALAEALGLDYAALVDAPGDAFHGPPPAALLRMANGSPVRTNGDLLERLELLCREMYIRLLPSGGCATDIPALVQQIAGVESPAVQRTLHYVRDGLHPALAKTTDEIANLMAGLDGRFVPPGPSGAPTRGMTNVFPTGRNFYSVDPKAVPSPAAWEVGRALGDALLDKYRREQGAYPEMVGVVVWGTSAMRTHGDDIAQVLYLLGVRPVWQAESRRIRGIEVIPLQELSRPRIDVTVRISGFFRDAFPNLIALIDEAVERVAALDEPPDQNFIRKHVRQEEGGNGQRVLGATYRVFGSKPGTYGAGILPLLEQRNWRDDGDLAEVYTNWGGYAYTRKEHGADARSEMRRRFQQIAVAVKNQDNREHDIFDSDDYMQYHGGMIATIRALTGSNPQQFFGDSSDPSRSRVRDLADEARRVFRSRVVNPKWIEGMKRHGYKGAFELAATVDYIFGYDATAQVIEDWMYERLAEAYVLDHDMQEFFERSNPWALHSISDRLLEAIQRGLWEHPGDEMVAALRSVLDRTDRLISR